MRKPALYLLQRIVTALFLFVSSTSVFAGTFSDETLTVDGRERRFLVHDYSDGEATSVVIVLHGAGGNGANAAQQTGFDRVAEREALIAVYPYGSGNRQDTLLSWNAAHCCVYAMQQDIDDVEFMRQLIDHLLVSRSVDPDRVYVTGLSNGGLLTHRIGFELGERLAAIAPVIAGIFGDEPFREARLPVLLINGAVDTVIRPEGGMPGGIGSFIPDDADRPLLPASAQVAYWGAVNGCTGQIMMETPEYLHTQYADCPSGISVEHYLVSGNGHAWPGGSAPRPGADLPVSHFDASEIIWAFFKRFRRNQTPVQPKPWFHDNLLQVPLLETGGKFYRARLKLVSSSPTLLFELQRARKVQSQALAGLPVFASGLLTLPFIQIGDVAYTAALAQRPDMPVQFTLQSLSRLQDQ